MSSRVRDGALGVLGLVAVAGVWELYKAVGPGEGWLVGETRVLPRTTDLAMPHVWDMVSRWVDPLTAAPGAPVLVVAVLQACVFSLGIAVLSWVLGVAVGMGLALVMSRVRIAESAILPLVVIGVVLERFIIKGMAAGAVK